MTRGTVSHRSPSSKYALPPVPGADGTSYAYRQDRVNRYGDAGSVTSAIAFEDGRQPAQRFTCLAVRMLETALTRRERGSVPASTAATNDAVVEAVSDATCAAAAV